MVAVVESGQGPAEEEATSLVEEEATLREEESRLYAPAAVEPAEVAAGAAEPERWRVPGTRPPARRQVRP